MTHSHGLSFGLRGPQSIRMGLGTLRPIRHWQHRRLRDPTDDEGNSLCPPHLRCTAAIAVSYPICNDFAGPTTRRSAGGSWVCTLLYSGRCNHCTLSLSSHSWLEVSCSLWRPVHCRLGWTRSTWISSPRFSMTLQYIYCVVLYCNRNQTDGLCCLCWSGDKSIQRLHKVTFPPEVQGPNRANAIFSGWYHGFVTARAGCPNVTALPATCCCVHV